MPIARAKALKERIWRPTLVCAGIAFALLLLAGSAHAAFPGKNGKIAYYVRHVRAIYQNEIHVVNQDGSGDTTLGTGTDPSWSPDGTKIAFEDGADFGGELWTMNADGTDRHQVVGKNSNGFVSHPTWSPDGSKLAFSRTRCVSDPEFYCTAVLAIVNSDGTGETTLGTDTYPRQPVWSPDGAKIAFVDNSRSSDLCCYGEIFTINPDGTGQSELNVNPYDDESPDWSPDGAKLLATRVDPPDGLYTMNRDGTGVSPFIPNRFQGAWSPDGKKIVFGANYEINVMNLDGTEQMQLTSGHDGFVYAAESDWQPLPGPQRRDYKNAAQFCKAERDFFGDEAFTAKYGGGSNAYGKCVSQSH
jgi:Tol biopolymer transport system component